MDIQIFFPFASAIIISAAVFPLFVHVFQNLFSRVSWIYNDTRFSWYRAIVSAVSFAIGLALIHTSEVENFATVAFISSAVICFQLSIVEMIIFSWTL